MAIVRWNPWNDVFALHSQVDRLFNAPLGQSMRPVAEFTTLPVDIYRTDDAFVVEASVPGFDPAEIDLTFEHGVLTIRAQRNTVKDTAEVRWLRRERNATSLYRQVALPDEVDVEKTTAAFDKGVLTVTMPRSQAAEPTRIRVVPASGMTTIDVPATETKAG